MNHSTMSGGIDLTRIIHEGSGGGEGFLLHDTAVQISQDLRKALLISLCLRDRLRSFRNEVPWPLLERAWLKP
jgi:hypothetical protein